MEINTNILREKIENKLNLYKNRILEGHANMTVEESLQCAKYEDQLIALDEIEELFKINFKDENMTKIQFRHEDKLKEE